MPDELHDPQLGISIRFIRQFDAKAAKVPTINDVFIVRMFELVALERMSIVENPQSVPHEHVMSTDMCSVFGRMPPADGTLARAAVRETIPILRDLYEKLTGKSWRAPHENAAAQLKRRQVEGFDIAGDVTREDRIQQRTGDETL